MEQSVKIPLQNIKQCVNRMKYRLNLNTGFLRNLKTEKSTS